MFQDDQVLKTQTFRKSLKCRVFYLFREESLALNFRAAQRCHTSWNGHDQIEMQGKYKEGSSLFLCPRTSTFICICMWIFQQRHFWHLATSESSRNFRMYDFCDIALWLTSIINEQWKESIGRGPSFSWRDGSSPAPSNAPGRSGFEDSEMCRVFVSV